MGCRKTIRLIVVLIALSSFESLLGAEPQTVIQGTGSYRERIALPPEAVFEAVIADVSRADALSDELGSVRIEAPGQVPIRFEIPYDASTIKEGHRYAVRARITVGGRIWCYNGPFLPGADGRPFRAGRPGAGSGFGFVAGRQGRRRQPVLERCRRPLRVTCRPRTDRVSAITWTCSRTMASCCA